ncbi:MAG: hydantoinase B/oxoprolinase family protein, partial [Actinomycetota bacterium]|nr:hydantoinase B/oxoprolinase family protein [Actinomycetota bacterium]
DDLAAEAVEELRRGPGTGELSVERRVHVRYDGTDTTLDVPEAPPNEMRTAFEQSYRQMFSFLSPDRALVVEAVSAEAVLPTAPLDDAPDVLCHDKGPKSSFVVTQNKGVGVQGVRGMVMVVLRDDLGPGTEVDGPAVVVEDTATTVVDEGWQARVSERGDLILRRVTPQPARHAVGTDVDPIRLEVFANRFMAIAEQMGTLLAGSAQSVNIKERLDFSCALFDPTGGLVANAPHIPVHLGSMGESVRHVLRANEGSIEPGDVYVLNDPYRGGTHLPDVTVVSPVFAPDGEDLWFVVASRGHHADIGGITPGSMPSASRDIDEEGVRIDNVLMIRDGHFRDTELHTLLTGGPHPARNPGQNIGDLRAQAAANAEGAAALAAMVEEFGLDAVQAYMGHVQANATEAVRRVIDCIDDGACTYELDTGAVIRVTVTVDRRARAATIDFTGTSAQTDDNFNAPTAVTRAAVLYVFRTLVDDDIPLNEGCLVPLRIVIPPDSMLDPSPPAAVVAGNVETSQCVVGALYRALGVMAEAQGTMNNVTFGNERHQYYETVAGGSGAGDGFHGTSCVQTHMTNSRLTDPEILESRYPVRVESFTIRSGSGGHGRWRGGDGAVRRIRFLEPMEASILSTHRRIAPYGMDGGSPGRPGSARLERSDASVVDLAATDSIDVGVDDVLVVETPGGGGFGAGARRYDRRDGR